MLQPKTNQESQPVFPVVQTLLPLATVEASLFHDFLFAAKPALCFQGSDLAPGTKINFAPRNCPKTHVRKQIIALQKEQDYTDDPALATRLACVW